MNRLTATILLTALSLINGLASFQNTASHWLGVLLVLPVFGWAMYLIWRPTKVKPEDK